MKMKLNTLPEKKFTKEKSMKKVIALSALVMSLAATSAFASCPCQLQQKAYIPVAPIQKVTYVAPADPCCCKVEPKPCYTGAAAPIAQKKTMWNRTRNIYNSTVGTFFTSMLGY